MFRLSAFRTVPAYVWTFLALISGIVFGGLMPPVLQPIATAVAWLIRAVVACVPLLIFAALSPSIATLVRRGLAGRFAGSVILWFVLSSAVAGLMGLMSSSLIFGIPFSTEATGAWTEALNMLGIFKEQTSASLPLAAIVGSVILGTVAAWIESLYRALSTIEKGIVGLADKVGYVMIPLVLLFGISLGVRFGARLGMGHYFAMTFYTAALCFVWFLF